MLTTHTQLLVAQAKRDAKKEELRRLGVEGAAVKARCAAVEAELYELEGQTRALYAQEAVERMRAHPGEVSVQRDVHTTRRQTQRAKSNERTHTATAGAADDPTRCRTRAMA